MSDDTKVDKLIKDLMEALPGYVPVENSNTVPANEKYALALAFKEKAFRSYLNRCINVAVKGFISVEDLRGLHFQQGRVMVLKELLRVSEQMFKEVEKLDKSLK